MNKTRWTGGQLLGTDNFEQADENSLPDAMVEQLRSESSNEGGG
jgi:hypothetical protein